MTTYVVITDHPDKLRRLHADPAGWRQVEFASAADALAWERRQCRSGAVALEGQGFRYGCAFLEEHCTHAWIGPHRAA